MGSTPSPQRTSRFPEEFAEKHAPYVRSSGVFPIPWPHFPEPFLAATQGRASGGIDVVVADVMVAPEVQAAAARRRYPARPRRRSACPSRRKLRRPHRCRRRPEDGRRRSTRRVGTRESIGRKGGRCRGTLHSRALWTAQPRRCRPRLRTAGFDVFVGVSLRFHGRVHERSCSPPGSELPGKPPAG